MITNVIYAVLVLGVIAVVFGLILSVAAKAFEVEVDERLPKINQTLYRQVRRVLSYNKSVRHLRGGEATRRKYLHR